MNIVIYGAGYVGVSTALLLAKKHKVILVDVMEEKVASINDGIYCFDDDVKKYVKDNDIKLVATIDGQSASINADWVIVCVPTNYDSVTDSLDGSLVRKVIYDVLDINPSAKIVIKSTLPFGFMGQINRSLCANILYAPEFLRESFGLHDSVYPSRIVIRVDKDNIVCVGHANCYIALLHDVIENKPRMEILASYEEAESIKLFSNAYLALRVSFFNELDTFAMENSIDTKKIIQGICADSRIGDYYNNPSFGYGGYCLPKDSRQMKSLMRNLPCSLLQNIYDSNEKRKRYIVNWIVEKCQKVCAEGVPLENFTIGIYRLIFKTGARNFRVSPMLEIMEHLRIKGFKVIVYEPLLENEWHKKYNVVTGIEQFKIMSSVIIANRIEEGLSDVKFKVITRDIWGKN